MSDYRGGVRQVLDSDVLVITLDNINYLARKSEVQRVIREDGRAPMYRKHKGKLVTDGLLFMAQTGKTVYAWTGDEVRYRLARYQMENVIEEPGMVALALLCPSEATA